jgi:pyruvate,orthophosphate dikinase
MNMKKYYSFSSTEFLDNAEDLDAIGSRGKRVMELASLGAPISPGFLLTNETVNDLSQNLAEPDTFFSEPMHKMEKIMGKVFSDAENPMLVKVVESPMLNMVNTFSTIHNIGLCDHTVDGFAKFVDANFAYHEYRNVIRKIIELESQTEITADRRKTLRAFGDTLKKARKKEQVVKAINDHRSVFPEAVFNDGFEQLLYVIKLFQALFKNSASSMDSSLLVQAMVFGNYGQEGLFGSYYTRDIITGDGKISGEFFVNAFDETERPGKPIGEIKASIRKDLERIGDDLEKHFLEIRRIRFTVESGKLWVIDQNPVPNKSTQSEIKGLLDLRKKGVVDDAYVINRIKPGRLSELLHPALDPLSVKSFSNAEGGIAGAVGAAIGRVYFSTDALIKAYRKASLVNEDTNFILALPSSFAEDVKAIEVAKGVISSEGGYASHAPVVARSLGKVAMVYPGIKFAKNTMTIGRKTVKEGEYITLNVPYYDPPIIYFGKASLTKPSPEGSGLIELLDIIQDHISPDFDVHANADQPADAKLARLFKAQGIGLCRTEHMFFNEKRIQKFRAMIIANDEKERKKALVELEQMQVSDFYEMLKTMAGLPVTIRLLDAPLHEFLPHTKESMDGFISFIKKKWPKITEAEIRSRCDLLKEFNPMLGHRGVRIAISFPEIYNMQVRAIFEAAYRLKKEKVDVHPEIMIPIVMTANEIKTIRYGKRIEGKSITGIREIEMEVREKHKSDPIDFRVGTMIELPAAALQADKIARYAEFFSFGTNDLTQTTNGLSRDDFNNFFSDYNEFDLLEENPFKVLGEQVKELIGIAAERGRLTRPDLVMGLCGEHGAEPENIAYVREIGLNYTSCSAYGIPIAKLAIAQMNLADKAKEAAK